MAAQKNRAQHRAARAKESRSRAGSGGRAARQRRIRRRRIIVFGAVVVLVLALAGGVTATLLASGGPARGTNDQGQDLSSQSLLTLPAASAVAQGPDGGYVTDDQRDVVERFDPATGTVEATSARLSGRPVALVPDGSDLWVAETVTNSVVEVTAGSLKILREVILPAGPSGLTVLGHTVWVSSETGKNLTPIDDRTGVAGDPVGVIAGAVEVASGYGALWVTGTTDLVTRIVPPRSGKAAVQSPFTVGQGPIGVAAGAGAVWVANAKSGTVSRVDPSTLAVTTLQEVGADPTGVAVAGSRVFVSSGTQQTVRVVSPTPSPPLAIGTAPRNLVPVGTAAWVAGSNPGRVLSVS